MSFFLFPGQGSQRPGMGKAFYEASPAAREVLDEAAALNSGSFLDTLFDGDQEALNETRFAQPALLAVGVATARHLETLGIRPDGCAGHSLGEIPALVIAGACGFADAMRFTRERARLMSEGVPEGGMAAVMGLAPEAIEAALPEDAEVANYNGPQQTIISGSRAGLEAAGEALKSAGAKRVIPLKVSGPFHSKYMRPAADAFKAMLDKVPFEAPKMRFVSSVTGGEVSDPARIPTLLAEQLYSPIRWTRVMATIGAVDALELGTGGVLKGLAKRTDGAPQVRPVETPEEAAALTDAHSIS